MAMALTVDRLASLNNDYSSASESSDEPELSHVERLQRAKESVYACLRSLRGLGRDGRRLTRDDELCIAGRNDVRFRDINRRKRDANNLEFWESKAQSLKDSFRRLHAKLHPPATTPRTVIPPAERSRRLVETWASSVDNLAPAPHSSHSPSSREHPPAQLRTESDRLPLLSLSSTPAALDNRNEGRMKRKRSYINDSDVGSRHPKKRFHLLAGIEAIQAASCDNAPVPLRRSARIAALPKKTYGR
ncbi:hypothetical protein F5Y08DRAFT_103450 [Xylaria arbuscula]|nr:hypothetical protein F5Y08DRAFT_103450 [Xylaria arbuscula]